MRKYFAVIAVFVFIFAFCFVGCDNNDTKKYFFDFNVDNIQINVGGEKNIFELDYSTNVYSYSNIHFSSTDENVATISSNGIIKAINVGNCKIVVNIVLRGDFISSSFNIFVVDQNDGSDTDDNGLDGDQNNDSDTDDNGSGEDQSGESGTDDNQDDEEDSNLFSFEYRKENGNSFVLNIYKNSEEYYNFDYQILFGQDDLIDIFKYGNCIDISIVENGHVRIKICDLGSNAELIFDNEEL